MAINDKAEDDLACLKQSEWLNGALIQQYYDLICKTGNMIGTRIYALSTYFYGKYKEEGYDTIARWTKKVTLHSFKHVVEKVEEINCIQFSFYM